MCVYGDDVPVEKEVTVAGVPIRNKSSAIGIYNNKLKNI